MQIISLIFVFLLLFSENMSFSCWECMSCVQQLSVFVYSCPLFFNLRPLFFNMWSYCHQAIIYISAVLLQSIRFSGMMLNDVSHNSFRFVINSLRPSDPYIRH